MRQLAAALLDLVLPPACAACGQSGISLCGLCEANLQWRPAVGCARCGEATLEAGSSCGSDHRDLANVSRFVAPLRYAGTGGALVRRFKLDADAAAGFFLARAMARAWRSAGATLAWRRALLVPVPLHRRRRRVRGFDQAAWLAGQLSRSLRLQAVTELLVRTRSTLPQGDPRVTSRQGNVEGAFAVRGGRVLKGRRVVLIDDVLTSGSTVRTCAALLRGAGAVEVAVITACRS